VYGTVGKVLNHHKDVAVVQCTDGNCQRRHPYVRGHQLHQSQTFLSRISLLRAPGTKTSLVILWCTKAWYGSPHHIHVECASHVLLHGSQPERQASGVKRLDPDSVFLYFNLALSSYCSFFRASVCLARSLLEHLKLTRWSINELVVLYVQEDHQSTSCLSALFHACGHLEKVCSSPLCASDVQYSQEFYTPNQHIRNLNCFAATSWLLCLIIPTPCSFHDDPHQGPKIKERDVSWNAKLHGVCLWSCLLLSAAVVTTLRLM